MVDHLHLSSDPHVIATYTGPLERLYLKTAMVRGSGQTGVYAQFNDISLEEAFGWHYLPKKHFVPMLHEDEL